MLADTEVDVPATVRGALVLLGVGGGQEVALDVGKVGAAGAGHVGRATDHRGVVLREALQHLGRVDPTSLVLEAAVERLPTFHLGFQTHTVVWQLDSVGQFSQVCLDVSLLLAEEIRESTIPLVGHVMAVHSGLQVLHQVWVGACESLAVLLYHLFPLLRHDVALCARVPEPLHDGARHVELRKDRWLGSIRTGVAGQVVQLALHQGGNSLLDGPTELAEASGREPLLADGLQRGELAAVGFGRPLDANPRATPDGRLHDHDRGLLGLGLGLLHHLLVDGGIDLIAVRYVQDVPAHGCEFGGDVLRERYVCGAVDRDLVVVVEDDELMQLEVPSQRGGLGRNALHEAAVASQYESVVVEQREVLAVEARSQVRLRDGHAYRVGETLS
mmetsp:Transcript_103005/g.268904  ORF Transcript_103005/g.268904 Transcript_103005/m.268904 type:complete len:387 (+) Transcript_103005:1146-2306(+)